jgi:hypothetical protein
VREVEAAHLLNCGSDHTLSVGRGFGRSQAPVFGAQRAENLRPVEPLPLTMVAKAHRVNLKTSKAFSGYYHRARWEGTC